MAYTEYLNYETVGKWWEGAGRGSFPLQAAAAISRLQKEQGLSFHEAFERLVGARAIVLVDDADPGSHVPVPTESDSGSDA